jgi:geranylgeranyl diphosphate synthase type II
MAGAGYPEPLRELVDAYLEQLHFSREAATAGLEEAMRYSLLAGGKRVRPVLTLSTAAAVGAQADSVLPFAAAVELIHTYSLIHDDLPAMDDDAMRRGRPTCHVAFGEDVAILAGDGLYAEAFSHLLSAASQPPERVLAAAAELAAATGADGMVGGQYVDVSGAAPAGPAGLRRLHELKTGRLIRASVTGVLLLTATKTDAEQDPLGRYAAELGVLFQIVDDILDVTGTDEALGKPHGSDAKHGKRTYVSEFGLDGAKRLAKEAHAACAALLDDAARRWNEGALDGLRRVTDYVYTRSS